MCVRIVVNNVRLPIIMGIMIPAMTPPVSANSSTKRCVPDMAKPAGMRIRSNQNGK